MSAVAGVPTRAVAGEGVQLVPTVPPQDFAVADGGCSVVAGVLTAPSVVAGVLTVPSVVAGVLTVPPKIAQELPVD